jgi:hypothetical protein
MQKVAAKRDAMLAQARESQIESFPMDLAAEIELAERDVMPSDE